MSTKMNLPVCQVTRACVNQVPPGMLVCSAHADELALALLMVPTLGAALEDALVKRQRFSSSGVASGRPDESPVPFNPRASLTGAQLLYDLTEAADLIANRRGLFRPMNTYRALGRWLAAQVPWIRASDRGPEMVRWLTDVIGDAERVVDRPADRLYLGGCDQVIDGVRCGAQLYALPRRAEHACPVCGWTYQVASRRAELMGIAGERWLGATDAARALVGFGLDVTASRVREWASRGVLRPVEGPRPRDMQQRHPMYRVADVLAVLDRIERRRAARELAHA
ncbi:hypothetical protein ACH473_10590 [Cellulosimicrobium funkei]|uniref:hypothetical protein n=1 Tax=Cellulosimicrobium funkei TaxID=264251 RepID=UPI0037AB26CA